MAMPFIMPPGSFERVDRLQAKGYFSRSTVLMFLFIVDHTLGQTMSNAISGLTGALLSVLNAALMHGVIPGGISESTPWFVSFAVSAHCVLFVWLVLWLNFGMNARIFCLSTFAFHWMEFMNPAVTDCVGTQLCSLKVGELVSVAIACGVALLCNILPTPSLAVWKARTKARETTQCLVNVWMDAAASLCGSSRADYRQEQMVADLKKMKAALETLDGYMLHSYYEFGLIRSVRNIREFLSRLKRTLNESTDRLLCTWNTCFGAAHDEMMTRLWPQVRDVIVDASKLLIHCTEIACGGKVLDHDEVPLRETAKRTREAVARLTASFKELKASKGIDGVTEELLDEHQIVFQVCAFGRITADLAEEFMAGRNTRPLPAAEVPTGIFERTVLADRNHLSFVVRSFAIMLLAFVAGFCGHSKTMLTYDAGTAAAAALMLRKAIGSSGPRNFGRLRGAVIGTIFGHVVFSMAGWCSWWGYLTSGLAIFSWVATSMFNHADPSDVTGGMAFGHSSAGASAGLLSAYFASNGIMEQCTTEVFTVNDVMGKSYFMIINSLAAVFLVFAVDTVLAPETAAHLATNAYSRAIKVITEVVSDLLKPTVLEIRPHTGELAIRMRKAGLLGRQAEAEPRLWRNPWRGLLFGDAMISATNMRVTLSGMEHSSVEGGRLGGGKADKMRAFTKLQSFAQVRKVVVEMLEHVEDLLDSALSQETGEVMHALGNPQLRRDFNGEFAAAVKGFVAEVNRMPEISQERGAVNSLELDMAGQVSMILCCTWALVAEASQLQRCLLERAH